MTLLEELDAACLNAKRKQICATHHSWYCACGGDTKRAPCRKCLTCRAAEYIRGQRRAIHQKGKRE